MKRRDVLLGLAAAARGLACRRAGGAKERVSVSSSPGAFTRRWFDAGMDGLNS